MTMTDPTKSAHVVVVAGAVTRVELVPIALSENGQRYG
jgi:hypothetical protein